MSDKIDAISLFSGGLDSILAAKLLEAQGLKVLCAHFYSPFFGNPELVPEWEVTYGLKITARNTGPEFSQMLARYPAHGVGSRLNPCVDCKIMQVRAARALMVETGAVFVATGEVLGQRPMSQRADSLRVIARDAGLPDLLLRPLSALHLPPTRVEEEGLVDRTRLLGISGRGRNAQLELARQFNIKKIPTPAGGCLLTEKENSRRYWPILKKYWQNAESIPPNGSMLDDEFRQASYGRQFWRGGLYWLRIGRNAGDNEKLATAFRPGDLLIKLAGIPGPLGLARGGATWPESILQEACDLLAAHSPRAVKNGAPVVARVFAPDMEKKLSASPGMEHPGWQLPSWEETKEEIRQTIRERVSSERQEWPET